MFTPYASKTGWTIGLELAEKLQSENFIIESSMMKFVRKSNDGRLFSFDVLDSAPQFDVTGFKKITIFISFDNVEEGDQELIEEATLYYFKKLSGDVSCIVDRFDCYPAASTNSPMTIPPMHRPSFAQWLKQFSNIVQFGRTRITSGK